jgi:predicted DsbA family dithiol-disulfide isomerase
MLHRFKKQRIVFLMTDNMPGVPYPLMEVYLDYIDGGDLFTWNTIEHLESDFVISFKYSAFPRRPKTWDQINAEEMEIHGVTLEGLLKMREDLRKTVEEMGMSLGMHGWTVDIRLAQELGKWAEIKGRGREMHKLLHNITMYSKDLGNMDILIDMVSERGFDADEMRSALKSGIYGPLVEADWEKARRWGITKAPTFIMEGFMIIGWQPYPFMSDFVSRFAKRKTKT